MKILRYFALFVIVGGLAIACTPSTSVIQKDVIRLNQLGYYPNQEKIAVVDSGKVEEFVIVDIVSGEQVFAGKSLYTAKSEWSDKTRTTLDFSVVTTPGEYILKANGVSVAFQIKDSALAPLADAALKSFYYQRTAMPIEEQYAGQWNRPTGHPDTHVLIHPSAASPCRPSGTVISSSKGWYDAGDYNKYIVNSGYSIGLMQAVYQLFPDYFSRQKLNIPESNNHTPDLLDEMHYNLDWMLMMQDPEDGGVYHKLTTPTFEGFVKPTDCKQQRYVVQKSVTAALDFAAVMAQAFRLFAYYEEDYPGFSKRALLAAEKAYAWAEKHPEDYYNQNLLNQKFQPAIATGEYGDTHADDEFFWAATELYFSTGKEIYREEAIKKAPEVYTAPGWGNTYALGIFAWLQPNRELNEAERRFADSLKTELLKYADKVIQGAGLTPFHAPYGNDIKDFFWGCLAEKCLNQGVSLVYAYLLADKEIYLANAYRSMDYILGRNATGFCYVTGFGTKSPEHPHHRLSASDGIEAPIPGFLVGGPNPGQQDKAFYPTTGPDESYVDTEDSYASNEVAINWNATLVALSSSLDALAKDLDYLENGFEASPKLSTGNSNPLLDFRYVADPTAVVYEGRVYVYGTNDHQQFEAVGKKGKNTYEHIHSLVMMSSEDMVNWTYHGIIDLASLSPWGMASWAPSVTSRMEEDGMTHFYLYYSNSGVGVGVLTAVSPVGPWRDPIGKNIVDHSSPGLGDCKAPFDPGVVIDSKGTGWLVFGGGDKNKSGTEYMPGNARIVRLGKDMISLDSKIVEIKAPYHFEANELDFFDGTWVYTYNTNWKERTEWPYPEIDKPTRCSMCYMTSRTPLDQNSWKYQGNYFKNPGDYGMSWTNNHTHLCQYSGNYYLFYHNQSLQDSRRIEAGFRSVCVDRIQVEESKPDIEMGEATSKGVNQIKSLDPFILQQAETTAATLGMEFDAQGTPGNMIALCGREGQCIVVRGVKFSQSPCALEVKVKGKGNIDVYMDDREGEAIASLCFDKDEWNIASTKVRQGISGIHDLYFVFGGGCFEYDEWKFIR